VELLRDLFDLPISVGTIHNRLQSAADKAAINLTRLVCNPSGTGRNIPGSQPVLVGSMPSQLLLLAAAEHRDEDTWGVHLLDASQQGLSPDYTIADAAKGLRAGQAAWPNTLSWRYFSHPASRQKLVSFLSRRAATANSRRQKLEQEMHKAKLQGRGHTLSTQMVLARRAELQAVQLATDVKSLIQWLNHDILALAGPPWAERQKLFDFIVEELSRRETLHRIRPLRIALKNQRDDLLAFAQVLDEKLVEIAQRFDTPLSSSGCLATKKNLFLCLLAALESFAPSITRKVSFNGSRKPGDATNPKSQFSGRESQFKAAQLLFLRRQLGPQYLDLLQFSSTIARLCAVSVPNEWSPTQ